MISLLGMNYHFVGDVIAGSFVGGIVGMYGAHLARLPEASAPSPAIGDEPGRDR